MSYRLKARAPLGAYGVSPTVSISRSYGRPGRGARAAGVALSAFVLLLVAALGAWVTRRQAATAASAAAALAHLREQQAQIDSLARQLAALRGANDQVRAEIAKLAVRPTEPENAQPRPEQSAASAAMPVIAPVAARAPAALPLAVAPVPPAPTHPDAAASEPPRRRAAHHPTRHRRHTNTVVVNGITYVRGREPHALGLPLD